MAELKREIWWMSQCLLVKFSFPLARAGTHVLEKPNFLQSASHVYACFRGRKSGANHAATPTRAVSAAGSLES